MKTSNLFARNIKRKSFSKIKHLAEIPDLVYVQRKSYDQLLQSDVHPDQRVRKGLQGVFHSIFPILDPDGLASLEFVQYHIGTSKYSVEESKQRGTVYSAPLKAVLRLVLWDTDPETGTRDVQGIKEQEVYLGDIPLMTKSATFVINGVERVIVSQMHRSPGVFFDHDKGKSHATGKFLYSARIIPYRGSWLDFEFDIKDLLHFRIDRRRKLPVTILLKAFGMTSKAIYDSFYDKDVVTKGENGWSCEFKPQVDRVVRLSVDLINADTNEVALKSGERLNRRVIEQLKRAGLRRVLIAEESLVERILGATLKLDEETTLEVGTELTHEHIEKLKDNPEITELVLLDVENGTPCMAATLRSDKTKSQTEALFEIFKVMRPGEPITAEVARTSLESMFFTEDRYDLSEVGRIKINSRIGSNVDERITVLTLEDIIGTIRQLVQIKNGVGEIDDIDNLGNRRVRSVGELVENQIRLGLVRLGRTVIERMTALDIESAMPTELVNPKILINVVKEFFGSSQFSQFMDQTNPLSEVTHKRRISALGPGGLVRDRASVEVRDVHITHYGRICPIETPEGQNIGLINSIATYARINKYGFIETPYRRVNKGIVSNDIVYLAAMEEVGLSIAQSNSVIDKDDVLVEEIVTCRQDGDVVQVERTKVDLIEVAPSQMLSVATALIPFCENDDANRALMGSNMQRQAVPLITSEAPFVGTGIESIVARDSGVTIVARHDGVVDRVDSERIVVKYELDGQPGVDVYKLSKFQRSNHSTCINQRPLVRTGDKVLKGDTIADGPSTDRGDLALGRNVLVAFMAWGGCNFEDSIVISESLVRRDVFTSVHIEVFSVVARDTRIGPEEITRDIATGLDRLEHLDESGIVRVGSVVKAGDVLVGKVTPKTESPMTPEEKLLRAIFGGKADDVRDTSLHVPPGVSGTVIEVRVFSRRGVEKDERTLAIEHQQLHQLAQDRDAELEIIDDFALSALRRMLLDQPIKGKGNAIATADFLADCSKTDLWKISAQDASVSARISTLKQKHDSAIKTIHAEYENKVEKIRLGDDLPQGVLKEVKVFVAMKHKLQPGDKMSGRHGNKGVISRIVPEEDMPYLEDGRTVEVILNPLGLPSRMNVGQILETHLGWAAANIGKQIEDMVRQNLQSSALRDFLADLYHDEEDVLLAIKSATADEIIELASRLSGGIFYASPVFDGAKVSDVDVELRRAGLDTSGQVTLIDGRTGEFFDRPVTVGYKYFLKLHHLVDDKIHARSIGPYSLVTQQPLGGKSHFGGQRFGEMECWALQAYGAAYTLQEMLTVKSDDVVGRVKIFESIVRNDSHFECGMPESFNVMIKELRSLCLNIELHDLKSTE